MYCSHVQQVGYQGGPGYPGGPGYQAGPGYQGGPNNKPVQPIQPLETLPAQVDCTLCHATGVTRVESKISSLGWIWAIGCCCFGFAYMVPCAFILAQFKEFTHYCSSCNRMISVYKPPFTPGIIAMLVGIPIVIFIITIVVIIVAVRAASVAAAHTAIATSGVYGGSGYGGYGYGRGNFTEE